MSYLAEKIVRGITRPLFNIRRLKEEEPDNLLDLKLI